MCRVGFRQIKFMTLFFVLLLPLLLLTAAGCGPAERYRVVNNDLAYHLHLVERKPLAELAEENIVLYAGRKEDGVYREMVLVANEREVPVPWETGADPFYPPELLLADLCRNGREELVVLLRSLAAGAGDWAVHVMDPLTWMEVHVADPLEMIREHVRVRVSAEPDLLVVELEGNTYRLNDVPPGTLPRSLSAADCFGSGLRYRLDQGRLKAVVPGLLPPATIFGEIVITYRCKEGALRKETMEFFFEQHEKREEKGQ